MSKILDSKVDAPPAPPLVQKSVFTEDTDLPMTMQDITDALAAKRAEQKVKLRRLAELHQEACDILNSLDA